MSSEKTKLFAPPIGPFLNIFCETFNGQGTPALLDINGKYFKGITAYPKMTHGDIEDADITKVASFIKDMTGIGVLVPDDGLEDYIRQVGHLPERMFGTRDMEDRRREQQEQSQPPEPKVSAEELMEEEEGDLPDNKVTAAKRRLGRI